MIDISNVANLRTRSGGKVLQAHKGKNGIIFETEDGGWSIVNFGGLLGRSYDSPSDLIHCPPDPWVGMVLPEWIALTLWPNGHVSTPDWVWGPNMREGEKSKTLSVSTRRFRLVPMEGEE